MGFVGVEGRLSRKFAKLATGDDSTDWLVEEMFELTIVSRVWDGNVIAGEGLDLSCKRIGWPVSEDWMATVFAWPQRQPSRAAMTSVIVW